MNIYIKPVEYCNLNCSHCYNPQQNDSIDYDNLINCLRGINTNTNDNYFILHGGEPLLAPPCKILNLIKEFPTNQWRITTNLCVELTRERLEILQLMNDVRTSFDIGIRFETIHNLMLWYRNVKTLRSMGINISINVCLSVLLLYKSPINLLKMLDKLGIYTLSFERITEVGTARQNNCIIPRYADVDEWLCDLYHASKQFPQIKIKNFEDVIFGLNKDEQNCRAAACCKSTMTINANGTIGTCPNDAQVNTIGDTNSDITEVINHKCKMSYAPKNECLICDKFDQCFGGCAQLEWQGDACPYPHKLAELIKGGK